MSAPDRSPASNLSAGRKDDFRHLWRRTTRNVLQGSLISALPAFVFYSVAFSYTPEQLSVLLKIFPLLFLAAFAVDLLLNWWYLSPYRNLQVARAAPEEIGRAYTRIHNLPLFSFVRVFGPHALTASIVAQLAVLYANAHWHLRVPIRDFWVYWRVAHTSRSLKL